MDSLEVSTVVYVPPPRVYEFLADFEGYANYSKLLESVERTGDGTAGTFYDITVGWWRLDHTVRSEVTDVDPPNRIDWRLLGSIAARGSWLVTPLSERDQEEWAAPEPRPADEPASLVTLDVRYDADSVDGDTIDLPSFVSLDAVVDRIEPLVRDEAERVVERIVADLEGEPRPVDLRVTVDSGNPADD